jgi:hypothetical protein
LLHLGVQAGLRDANAGELTRRLEEVSVQYGTPDSRERSSDWLLLHLIALVGRGSASSVPGTWPRRATAGPVAIIAAGIPVALVVSLAIEVARVFWFES